MKEKNVDLGEPVTGIVRGKTGTNVTMLSKAASKAGAEITAAVIKGLVSTIPVVGGVILEVGNIYLNPLEKRKERWISEVSSAIDDIERRFAVLPEQLQDDERFISFLYQSTIVALKNHQHEKIRSLRAALVSAASPNAIAEDVAFQFLRYVDELTPSHINILHCLQREILVFASLDNLQQVYENYSKLCSLQIERIAFRSFLHDLDARFLIHIGDTEDLPEFASKASYFAIETSSMKRLEVTSFGRNFLEFIKDDFAPTS